MSSGLANSENCSNKISSFLEYSFENLSGNSLINVLKLANFSENLLTESISLTVGSF